MTKKIIYFLTIIFFSIFLSFCSNQSNNEGQNYFDEACKMKFGTDYKISYNSDSSLVLCISPKSFTNNLYTKNLKYFVFDNRKDSIIFEESVLNAAVSWKKKNVIYINIFPEVQEESNSSMSYYIDLITNKKTFIK